MCTIWDIPPIEVASFYGSELEDSTVIIYCTAHFHVLLSTITHSVKMFLPETYRKSVGIAGDVEKVSYNISTFMDILQIYIFLM